MFSQISYKLRDYIQRKLLIIIIWTTSYAYLTVKFPLLVIAPNAVLLVRFVQSLLLFIEKISEATLLNISSELIFAINIPLILGTKL